MRRIGEMKKLGSLALLMALLLTITLLDRFSMTVKANVSGVTGDCTWEIQDKVLTISGNGPMGSGLTYQLSEYDFDEIIINQGVTSIGNTAFAYYCSDVTSITIPDSVTSIGNSAFFECSGLTNIVIPDNVTSIGYDAFAYCTGLTDITIPGGVKNIGDYAFQGCAGLASIDVDKNNSIYHSKGNCIIKSETNTLILGCKNSSIPDYVRVIGVASFEKCSGLTSITIPNSVVQIMYSAFGYCTGLTNITIPNSVTSFGPGSFQGCTGLISIDVAKNNPKYHSDGNCIIESETNTLIMGCKNSIIPNYVTVIGTYAFEECSGLTNITIPSRVESIGENAFYYCTELTDVVLSDSVKSIERDAFYFCLRLENVWYQGTEEEKENIDIGYQSNVDCLATATWHFNTCKEEHTYSNNCDSSCNKCDWTRLKNEHNFCMNNGLSCEYCGYSQRPDKPILDSKTNGIVKLGYFEGFEYSKDGENWQDSNVFTGLSENTTYTFYQRVKETPVTMTSEKSDGLSVYMKCSQVKPSVPIIVDCTDTTITLTPISNGEYSLDNVNWQKSHVFSGLLCGTEYTIYQRYAETSTHFVSETSEPLIVKTYIIGDINNDNEITDADALYLLYHTIFGDSYPIEQHCDYNHDGAVTDADALYLLYHTIFGDSYPIK